MFTFIIYSLNYLTVTFLCFWCSLEDNSGSSRRTRLLRLCSYLQEKYKHMCRKERASIRQKRYRYAFRKALLHAANNDPDCAGQLIQELSGASWYSHNYILQFCLAFHRCLTKKKIGWPLWFCFLVFSFWFTQDNKCQVLLLLAQSWIFFSLQFDSRKAAEHRSTDLHWQHKGSALQQQSSALH